jgi:hypothetical protein
MRTRHMRKSSRYISKRATEKNTIRANGQRKFTMKNFIDSSPKLARISNAREEQNKHA